MKFSRNPFIACIVSVCYVLNFSTLLLTLCYTDELQAEYSNNENREIEERDYINDASNLHSTNHASVDVLEFNSPRNYDEGYTAGGENGKKFVHNNNTPYLPMKVNQSKSESNDSDTDYYYDLDESHNFFNWSELIPTLVVYGATMLIGIAGNSLIIFTICRYRRMKSTTNVFLASLASADLLLIIICIPVKVAKLFSYTWSMGYFLCKGVHYLQHVSAICSVLTLTAMSIERYYAIIHPMKAKYMCTISQARKIIFGIWVASFLLAVPNLFTQDHALVGKKLLAYYCVPVMDTPSLWRFHEVYMLLLILVIPTCIMIVAYGSISWEIWHVMQKRYDMTSGQALNPGGGRGGVESFPLRYSKRVQRNTNSNAGSFRESAKKANALRMEEENNTVKQVIKMLVAVVVLFVICWAPLLVLNVLYAYDAVSKYSDQGSHKNVQSAFTVMAYSNSCINPLVYGFMSKNFRESFYKALCRCCYRGGRAPKRHLSVSQTRTTSVRYADSRFRWPHSTRQQYRRSYCATTEIQEYPEDYLSTVGYNSKNCWFKMEDRAQSDGV